MKQLYLKFVKRAYRSLRHPRFTKIPWLSRLLRGVFNRVCWTPTYPSVANGLSTGLFCSMLPIPFQTILASFLCLKFRGNIPIAFAASFLTNPLTQIPTMLLQERLGQWTHDFLHVPGIPYLDKLNINLSKVQIFDFQIFGNLNYECNAGNFLIGVLLSSILLAVIAHPLVYSIRAILPSHKGLKQ